MFATREQKSSHIKKNHKIHIIFSDLITFFSISHFFILSLQANYKFEVKSQP